MATRMQQRRGTAQQWTDADPILAAGEIGFETDTSQFKIGDGVNAWSDLSYFKNLEDLGGTLDDYVPLTQKGAANGVATLDGTGNIPASQLANIIDGAPAALDTLNEIATIIGDGGSLVGTLIGNIAQMDTVLNGLGADMVTVEGDVVDIQNNINTIETNLQNLETSVTGLSEDILDHTQSIDTNTTAIAALELADGTHAADTTNVHGILDTAELATKSYAEDQASAAQTAAESNAADTADTKVSLHNAETTNVHGILNTADLATASDVATAVSDHNGTLNVHGISNTAELETQTGAQAKADLAQGAAENYADSLVGDVTVDGTTGNTVAARIASAEAYTDSQIDSHVAITTNVHGIADTSKIVLKDAQATTLDGSLTVSGNLVVEGTTTTVSAQDLVVSDPLIYIGEGNNANLVDLGLVSSFDNGTYQHSGIARDASDNKWKFFKGVTDEPTTTINFAQGSLDDLAVNNVTVAGVVFTDGTQSKEGVPSRTPIIQKTASYTLSALTERDSMIEVSSSSGTTVTIPAESSVNYPVGTSIDVLQTSTGQVTIAGAAGVTVNATPGLKLRTQWSSATLFKRAADTWVVYGDLMA
jgi:hypothetical protein